MSCVLNTHKYYVSPYEIQEPKQLGAWDLCTLDIKIVFQYKRPLHSSMKFKKTLFKQIDLFDIYLSATTLFCMKTNV